MNKQKVTKRNTTSIFIYFSLRMIQAILNTVKPQWLEHLWDHGNLLESWVVRASKGQSWRKVRKQI